MLRGERSNIAEVASDPRSNDDRRERHRPRPELDRLFLLFRDGQSQFAHFKAFPFSKILRLRSSSKALSPQARWHWSPAPPRHNPFPDCLAADAAARDVREIGAALGEDATELPFLLHHRRLV